MKNKTHLNKISFILLLTGLMLMLFTNIACAREKTGIKELPLLVKSVKLTTCIVKEPQDFDKRKSYPLLIGLHGNGGNAASFAEVWNEFSNPGFLFAVPQGPYVYSHAHGNNRGMYSWYWEKVKKEIWEIADPISEEFLLNVVDAATQKYKISKIYILGFSQGTSLAYAVGIKNFKRIDGIICVGGRFPNESFKGKQIAAGSSLPMLLAAGNHDPHMSLKRLKRFKDYFQGFGYDVTDFVYEGGHQITRELLKKVQEWMKKK